MTISQTIAARKVNVLVMGSGVAGSTAAIYLARSYSKPVLLHGNQPGGQLMTTLEVENYPGFANTVSGPDIMDQMHNQAKKFNVEVIDDHIQAVNFKTYPFEAKGNKTLYYANSVIICTGAQAKWLNIPSETKFKGYGVSSCATCDGYFFRGKKVVVIGGGNTAVEEALHLANLASQVILIYRGNEKKGLRAEAILQDELFNGENKDKITIMWNSTIEEILGNDNNSTKAVTGVKIKNSQNNTTSIIKVDGVFIAIGHAPNTSLFFNQLDIDAFGYIITQPNSTKTSIEGIFAAGDVQDSKYRQAVTAASSGCMAALEVQSFLKKLNYK
ncbi:thioredoxin-disulfide reductase [Orientia chuto str. Dubai]|uniref:Thioredoxin reductase n=1 Tax=Orientia chuto str. Dubai TaxID=1359168 RepID=A0A0F3MKQ8_9RICK|nr:thioredoxin-disulfide reductase [Candidatus Orientia mediorientalis]KJV56373.1 thioredoxin-disulfide reductase [Orientia chuto str. Dubai]